MQLFRKQTTRGKSRFLVLTEKDPKTGADRAVIVDTHARTVRRVPSVPSLLRSEPWQPVGEDDPTLDDLVRLAPALRRFRGIELRLPSGETGWIRWRQWTSSSADAQRLLTETTQPLMVPTYEPDGDHFLAVQAAALLGGEVLDSPRSTLPLGDEAY